jgi:hypothetical protein
MLHWTEQSELKISLHHHINDPEQRFFFWDQAFWDNLLRRAFIIQKPSLHSTKYVFT